MSYIKIGDSRALESLSKDELNKLTHDVIEEQKKRKKNTKITSYMTALQKIFDNMYKDGLAFEVVYTARGFVTVFKVKEFDEAHDPRKPMKIPE